MTYVVWEDRAVFSWGLIVAGAIHCLELPYNSLQVYSKHVIHGLYMLNSIIKDARWQWNTLPGHRRDTDPGKWTWIAVNFKISIAVCLMLPDQMVTCLTHFKTSLRNSLIHKQTLAVVSFYNIFNILNIKIKQKQRYHNTALCCCMSLMSTEGIKTFPTL